MATQRKPQSQWKKWQAPPNFIAAEQNIQELVPASRESMRLLEIQLDTLINHEKDAQRKEQYKAIKTNIEWEQKQNQVYEQYVVDFFMWLLGRSKYNYPEETAATGPNGKAKGFKKIKADDNTSKTPWGTQPLTHLPEVQKLFTEIVDQRFSAKKYLAKLRLQGGPRDLTECWNWYKYIVHEDGITDNLVQYANWLEYYDGDQSKLPKDGKYEYYAKDTNTGEWVDMGEGPEVKHWDPMNPVPPPFATPVLIELQRAIGENIQNIEVGTQKSSTYIAEIIELLNGYDYTLNAEDAVTINSILETSIEGIKNVEIKENLQELFGFGYANDGLPTRTSQSILQEIENLKEELDAFREPEPGDEDEEEVEFYDVTEFDDYHDDTSFYALQELYGTYAPDEPTLEELQERKKKEELIDKAVEVNDILDIGEKEVQQLWGIVDRHNKFNDALREMQPSIFEKLPFVSYFMGRKKVENAVGLNRPVKEAYEKTKEFIKDTYAWRKDYHADFYKYETSDAMKQAFYKLKQIPNYEQMTRKQAEQFLYSYASSHIRGIIEQKDMELIYDETKNALKVLVRNQYSGKVIDILQEDLQDRWGKGGHISHSLKRFLGDLSDTLSKGDTFNRKTNAFKKVTEADRKLAAALDKYAGRAPEASETEEAFAAALESQYLTDRLATDMLVDLITEDTATQMMLENGEISPGELYRMILMKIAREDPSEMIEPEEGISFGGIVGKLVNSAHRGLEYLMTGMKRGAQFAASCTWSLIQNMGIGIWNNKYKIAAAGIGAYCTYMSYNFMTTLTSDGIYAANEEFFNGLASITSSMQSVLGSWTNTLIDMIPRTAVTTVEEMFTWPDRIPMNVTRTRMVADPGFKLIEAAIKGGRGIAMEYLKSATGALSELATYGFVDEVGSWLSMGTRALQSLDVASHNIISQTFPYLSAAYYGSSWIKEHVLGFPETIYPAGMLALNYGVKAAVFGTAFLTVFALLPGFAGRVFRGSIGFLWNTVFKMGKNVSKKFIRNVFETAFMNSRELKAYEKRQARLKKRDKKNKAKEAKLKKNRDQKTRKKSQDEARKAARKIAQNAKANASASRLKKAAAQMENLQNIVLAQNEQNKRSSRKRGGNSSSRRNELGPFGGSVAAALAGAVGGGGSANNERLPGNASGNIIDLGDEQPLGNNSSNASSDNSNNTNNQKGQGSRRSSEGRDEWISEMMDAHSRRINEKRRKIAALKEENKSLFEKAKWPRVGGKKDWYGYDHHGIQDKEYKPSYKKKEVKFEEDDVAPWAKSTIYVDGKLQTRTKEDEEKEKRKWGYY